MPGFRVQFVTDWKDDVAAFLGASYFRAVGGDTRQYGLSARALAVDTAFPRPEEFPRFTSFWFERPAKDAGTLTLYALLDSPSIAGALRMQIAPGRHADHEHRLRALPAQADRAHRDRAAHQHVLLRRERSPRSQRLAARDPRFGRPLDVDRRGRMDLAPARQPAQLHLNSYFDDNPRGFGLLQRDRNFDHYQDDGVYYDRRPSLWVEPKPGPNGGWGKGAVQLVEIPTVDETFDNIVAFWNPMDKPKPGQELLFGYRLYWGDEDALLIAARPDLGDAHRDRRHRGREAPILFVAFCGRLQPEASSARCRRIPASRRSSPRRAGPPST